MPALIGKSLIGKSQKQNLKFRYHPSCFRSKSKENFKNPDVRTSPVTISPTSLSPPNVTSVFDQCLSTRDQIEHSDV